MQIEAKKHVNRLRGFTLVELILVVATIGLVAGALVGLISNSYEDWKLGSNRSTLLQDGQAAMEQMVRILRQAKGFSAVSSPTDTAGYITFTDVDGQPKEFRLNNSTNELQYGEPASLSTLAGSVSSLVFTCYDVDANSLADPIQARNIRAVHITTTLVDPDNSSLTFPLSGRIFCQEDFLNDIAINEIMYNPSGGGSDAPKEWVEIYNSGDSIIDTNGWAISGDLLIEHSQFGNGSTAIPAGGYAVITAATTNVYTELVTNGGFEAVNISSWIHNPSSSWSRTTGDAHGGTCKLESTAAGATSVYQQITVPSSGFNNCLFLFWERTTAPVAQTQIMATIRNLSDQVLATGYSGQMGSNWTCHTMDITAFAGQTIRIYFDTNKATSSGSLMLDDVSAATSYVGINAIRLSSGDGQIGGGLADNGDTVTVTNGSFTVDSVTYDDGWGGDGDGTSLERIDPQGSSNDQSNWTSGPVNGTPGSAN
jgi:type II secretory pathway pseudopilin PulG